MNYKISKQAEIDLENIWLYTFEEWSIDQADYYFDLIMDEIEYISKNPKRVKIIMKSEKVIFVHA